MERLDQGHLHPKLEVPRLDISQPGIGPGREESSPEKIHSNNLCNLLLGTFMYIAAQVHCGLYTWTNTGSASSNVG
jgi:hypothetical protein